MNLGTGETGADPGPLTGLRAAVRGLPASRIREVANAGFGRTDLVRFWFGESQKRTPDYIARAAIEAIGDGDTFYTHNNGQEALREQIAGYLGGLHRRPFGMSRVSVTSSGVSALSLTMQAVIDRGDRVVLVTPVWPNIPGIANLLGADIVRVPLGAREGRWRLDLQALLDVLTPSTRLLILNSPGNPTGWVLPPEDRQVILEHCRRLGIWILADDVYERLVFDSNVRSAPSFLEIADPEDRLLCVNSFSKAWLMTGWRLGWIVAPAELEVEFGKLIEFNTSCAPGFIQRAGLVALRDGEPHVAALRSELEASRRAVVAGLEALPGVEALVPDGGMYVCFRIAGWPDSLTLALRLVEEAGLGLAPGVAFGPEGEGWLRWCIAADPAALSEGMERLAGWLRRGEGARTT